MSTSVARSNSPPNLISEEMRAKAEEYSGQLEELKGRGEAARKAKKRALRLAAGVRKRREEEGRSDYLDAPYSSTPHPKPFRPDWATKPLGAQEVLSASDETVSDSADSAPADAFSTPASTSTTPTATRLAKTFYKLRNMILEGEVEELAAGLIKKEKKIWEKRERVLIEEEVRDEMKQKERKAREGYLKALEE